ncbi:Hypothetical_protein [Hexamita inflata]|uniref:Hypothetical_protein n=1 Tax=Hexamita inflata TaxID=28002 RepID=A0AA86QKM5_9EUKA|nr:Hypothetical protein HINF_LOCUS47600 [Hexamita inflata]CAI9960008.1 Hypothetical protein HINF_LOCUS47653 [Hexamita inflata]CAI9960010.1 Hypothetical protein HINF_LOCUS47655 [Hexamita inflata]CAI9960012.1 Hypothetical protein HINF_LOCUS47657 [Hexamita inflata]
MTNRKLNTIWGIQKIVFICFVRFLSILTHVVLYAYITCIWCQNTHKFLLKKYYISHSPNFYLCLHNLSFKIMSLRTTWECLLLKKRFHIQSLIKISIEFCCFLAFLFFSC